MYRLSVFMCVLLAGCSGGGDGDASSAAGGTQTTAVTLYYPNGRVEATGSVEIGTTIRSGHWNEYFDVADSAPRWDGTYVHGVIDDTQDWTEWNGDRSVRVDWTDH